VQRAGDEGGAVAEWGVVQVLLITSAVLYSTVAAFVAPLTVLTLTFDSNKVAGFCLLIVCCSPAASM